MQEDRRSRRLPALAYLAIVGLSGCAGTQKIEDPPVPPPAAAAPAAPEAQSVTLALTPRLRTVPELDSLSAQVPAQGVQRADTLHIPVTANGTPGGAVEAWLQTSSEAVGRTTLNWNASRTRYEGVLAIPASTVAAGDYPVMAILRIEDEETDPLASTETVRIVEPMRGIPPETRNRVASFRASFSTNSDLLDSQDDEALQQLAKELLPFADLIEAVVVQGHCDARGPETYNETLGARRAGTTARGLRAFLQEKIAVASESLGETAADQTAQDEAIWRKDRWARLDLKERAPAQGR